MSKQQWGHGFFSGLKQAEKLQIAQEDFPVGFFFTYKGEDGKIERQGMVARRSGDKFLIRFFSWADGYLGDSVHPYSLEDMSSWTWYETAKQLRLAVAEHFGWNEDVQEAYVAASTR